MPLFFYLFTFAINLWHQKFVTADITAVFVNNQHGIQRRGQDFDKKLVFEGVHSREVDKGMSWTKSCANKLLKKLRDTGTVDRRPGSGRPCSEKNSYAFVCLIFQMFCLKHINTLIIHSYTRRGIKIGAQTQFVRIFFHIC